MKKNLIFASVVIIVAVAICWVLKQPVQTSTAKLIGTNQTVSSVPTSKTATVKQQSIPVIESAAVMGTNTKELVLSNYETIEDLKQIKSLHNVGNYLKYQDWISQSNLVAFELNGNSRKSMVFIADDIWVLTDKADGHVTKLNLHSSIMDIDKTRKLGLELCDMLGRDPTDFIAWCNKVGNQWVDAPLFSSGGFHVPNSNQYNGFSVRRTLDDQNPWYIDFFVTTP